MTRPVPVIRVFPLYVLSSNYSAFQVISPNNSNAAVYFDASLSSDVDGIHDLRLVCAKNE